MQERHNIVTMKGNPVTLIGTELKIGDRAPDFHAFDNNFNLISLKNFEGKVLILSAVPSLDTSVCDIETRRFNKEAASLNPDINIITISMDLPFAQKRWCGAAGVDRVVTLSDYLDASFGLSYGVLIKEFRLLARAVFVTDKDCIIRYIQVVKDTTEEPEYEAALSSARTLISSK